MVEKDSGVKVFHENNFVKIVLSGTVTESITQEMINKVEELQSKNPRNVIVVDMEDVKYLSSSSIGALVLLTQDATVYIINIKDDIRSFLSLAEVEIFFKFIKSYDEM